MEGLFNEAGSLDVGISLLEILETVKLTFLLNQLSKKCEGNKTRLDHKDGIVMLRTVFKALDI